MTTGEVLVAGIGNIFLGDDGFGPEAARRLAADPLPRSADGATVKIVDYGIRGMHLAYDLLDGYDRLILLDALPRGGEPGDVVVLEVGPEDIRSITGSAELDAHGMAPVAVLGSLEQLGGRLPPTVVIGCEPLTVEETLGLSPAVEAAVDVAVEAVRRLLEPPVPSASTPAQEVHP